MFTKHEVDLSAGRVSYYAGGQGRPLLYLHSAGGVRLTPAVEKLAESFSIRMPVLPGFDGTRALDGVKTMPDLANLVAEFAGTVIGEPCDLAGHSFGGWVATWLTVLHPERVGLLVLQCPAGFRPDGVGGLGGDPATFQKRMYAHPEKLPPEHKSAEIILANRQMAGRYNGGAANDRELIGRLREIASLTLILHGTKDGIIPPESARLLKASIRRSNLLYIYDAAHNIEVDQPESYADVVRDFLTRGEVFIVKQGEEELAQLLSPVPT
jgi:pimeloyl-ACP methyl ester carboxylesterase